MQGGTVSRSLPARLRYAKRLLLGLALGGLFGGGSGCFAFGRGHAGQLCGLAGGLFPLDVLKHVHEGVGFLSGAGDDVVAVQAVEALGEQGAGFHGGLASGHVTLADDANAQPVDLVRSDDFADFYKNPQGYFAVGGVDDRIKQALKAETVVCCLSDETLLKNQKHHPDLQLDDYLQINKVLQDYDILVQDTEKTVVAVKKISGKNYWLAVKVTRNGNEIFTQTYHLAEDRQLRKLITKGTRLK